MSHSKASLFLLLPLIISGCASQSAETSSDDVSANNAKGLLEDAASDVSVREVSLPQGFDPVTVPGAEANSLSLEAGALWLGRTKGKQTDIRSASAEARGCMFALRTRFLALAKYAPAEAIARAKRIPGAYVFESLVTDDDFGGTPGVFVGSPQERPYLIAYTLDGACILPTRNDLEAGFAREPEENAPGGACASDVCASELTCKLGRCSNK